MKQLWMINKVLWKQYIYKHRIWLVLFLLSAVALRFGQMQNREEGFTGILVGVCVEDEEGEELFRRLQGQHREMKSGGEGVFRFCLYEEPETMLRDVKNGSLECGYVLPGGFFENLSQGKMRKQITLYHSSSSGAHKLSYEVVFSHLFEMLSEGILTDWLKESGMEEAGMADIAEQLLQRREAYEEGDATFSFTFEHVGKKQETEEAVLDTARGVMGVVIFFLSLLGLANCCEMSEKAGAFAKREALRVERWSLHIAVMGSVLTGGIFLAVAGFGKQPLKELLGLLVYFVILEVYLGLLKGILRTPAAVYGAVPVLLLGSVLLCPVFFRLETFIPMVGYLGKAFPVYWYLNLFI